MRFERASLRAMVILSALAVTLVAPLRAWFTPGHAMVTRAAVAALPREVPEFFRAGGWAVGHHSVDPDVMKSRGTPELRAVEEPEHYLDSELLQGARLPPDRWAYLALLQDRRISPTLIGTLPYAVHEGLQRLTMAFAEHRRWPDDPHLRQQALVYAGHLAHYAGDLDQPLHTTLHHDGRALPDHSSPRTGIHQLVDGLFEKAPIDPAALARGLVVGELADPWAAIQAEIDASHALVERVYALEPQLRTAGESGQYPPPVVAFTEERFRATATFLANLFYTAWRRSATIELPSWHDRPSEPRPGAEVILRPRQQ
jgi:hypothetical protein